MRFKIIPRTIAKETPAKLSDKKNTPLTPTVRITLTIIRFLLFSKLILAPIIVFKPLAEMYPYNIIAQPANTTDGIELIKAVIGAMKPITPRIIAEIIVIHTEPTLLKPIVATLSPYEVFGKPPIAVPTVEATPSPIKVRCKPGFCVKSVPRILDSVLWSE